MSILTEREKNHGQCERKMNKGSLKRCHGNNDRESQKYDAMTLK